MTASSVLQNGRSVEARESRARKLLAEVRQMSRISQREEGLLNHAQAAAVLGLSTSANWRTRGVGEAL